MVGIMTDLRNLKMRLVNRAIYTTQFPEWKECLEEDGFSIKMTRDGYELYIGEYQITNKSLANTWNCSTSSVRRFVVWCIQEGLLLQA